MQTWSWDEIIELTDGAAFDIDFFQDFSNLSWQGCPVKKIPIQALIIAIIKLEKEKTTYPVEKHISSAEERERSQEFWTEIDEYQRKERKLEKKYNKSRDKPKNIKEAVRNFNTIVKELGG